MTYQLVRYIEDDVLYCCKSFDIRNTKDDDIKLVRYFDKAWYPAIIVGSGNKLEVSTLRRQLLKNSQANLSHTSPEKNNFNSTSSLTNENQLVSSVTHEWHLPTPSTPLNENVKLSSPLSTPKRYNCRVLSVSSPRTISLPPRRLFVSGNDYDSPLSDCSHPRRSFNDSPLDDVFVEENPSGTTLDVSDLSTEDLISASSSINAEGQPCENLSPVTIEIVPTDQSTYSHSDEESTLPCVSKLVLPKKKRDKKQCCLYCGQLVFQLPRHLTRRHKDENMVLNMSKLSMSDPKRLEILADLRKRGNFKNNCAVLRGGEGNLIVSRRPDCIRASDDFVPCSNCFLWVTRVSLYRHMKHCGTTRKKWTRYQGISNNLLPILPDASTLLKDRVLSRMTQDNIFRIIRSDWLILRFGSSLCQRHNDLTEKHLATYIATKMRELARLVEEICKKSEISGLADALCPAHFDLVVDCTKVLAGFDEETGRFATPSLALKLGFSLVKCANLLINRALTSSSDSLLKQAQDFITLYEIRWTNDISRHSHTTLKILKHNQPSLLPVAEDIKVLNTHLNNKETELSDRLIQNYDYNTFSNLNKVIISKLILFNRKRAGETSRIFLENFKSRHSDMGHSDIFSSLSDSDKTLARTFSHMQIRGKHGRTVPMLMPKLTEINIELLLRNRIAAGIPENNPYLFAKPTETGFFDGGAALTKLAKEVGILNHKSLRSTNLRKHVATMTQLMNLREHEMEAIANFLGHDLSVHKQYYKLPDSAIHLAKVSKLLMAVSGGNVQQFKGCNLDDIDISLPEPERRERRTSARPEPRESTSARNDSDVTDSDAAKSLSDDADSFPQRVTKKTKPSQRRPYKPRNYSNRVAWKTSEIDAVERNFGYLINSREIPGKQMILTCISSEEALRHRTWLQVKSWIKNKIAK